MMRKSSLFLLFPALLTAAFLGCGGGPSSTKELTKDSAAKDTDKTAAKDADKTADDLPGLKELDEADRKLAEQQEVCPVSGSPLGSMDKPYKMTVKNRVVFLCCEDCKAEINKDPDKYLKKLDALLAKKK